MDKQTKKKYLEMLESNDFYKFALQMAPNEDEKKKIKAYAEDVFVRMVEGLSLTKKTFEEHPEKVVEVAKTRIPKDIKDE